MRVVLAACEAFGGDGALSGFLFWRPASSCSGGPACVCLQMRACLADVHVSVWSVRADGKYSSWGH